MQTTSIMQMLEMIQTKSIAAHSQEFDLVFWIIKIHDQWAKETVGLEAEVLLGPEAEVDQVKGLTDSKILVRNQALQINATRSFQKSKGTTARQACRPSRS